MMPLDMMIFDKTDKGREEIATRKHHLSAKLRPLLVMIDGKHTVEDLLKKVAGLGVDQHGFDELLSNEFIHVTTGLTAAPAVAVTTLAPVVATVLPPVLVPASVQTITASNAPAAAFSDNASQMSALNHFFNETIKSTIGLRGFTLQLKAERANTIEEFRALREPYLQAVLKAKGSEMALSLRSRLDELLDSHQP